MTYIAITIVIVWAILVAYYIYNNAILSGLGKHNRPTVFRSIFSLAFLVIWGVPTAIFLAIFGGVFWW